MVGGGWVVVCKPILVFSLSLGQAEQKMIADWSSDLFFKYPHRAEVSHKSPLLALIGENHADGDGGHLLTQLRI